MVPPVGLFSRKKKDADLEELPPEAAAIVEQLRDVFPDASISVDESVEVSVQDVLTDAEFEAEKARVLGEG